MAKKYNTTDSGLLLPDWLQRDRRRVVSDRGMIFTPGGGAAPGCHCSVCKCPTATTVSGDGSLASGVLTPSISPTGWVASQFIGSILTIDGTGYRITANTTTTATVAEPPANGTYDWSLSQSISADGTVTWITHTVDAGVITRIENEGPCVTFYVDSVSGGGTETGLGTEDDPWTNLNTVFAHNCIYLICTTYAATCPKVKVLVKGTIDYAIVGNAGRNYGRNLVIEPWGEEIITIEIHSSSTVLGVSSVAGCIWKCVNATCNTDGNYSQARCFVSCIGSTFDTCIGTGTSTGLNSFGIGFYSCIGSTFDTCIGTGTGEHGGYGFLLCASTFKACVGTGDGISSGTRFSLGYGIDSCSGSTFDTCFGTGTSTGPDGYGGHGFRNCYGSTYHTCTGTGSNESGGMACGFYGCATGSTGLDTCTGSPNTAPCDVVG